MKESDLEPRACVSLFMVSHGFQKLLFDPTARIESPLDRWINGFERQRERVSCPTNSLSLSLSLSIYVSLLRSRPSPTAASYGDNIDGMGQMVAISTHDPHLLGLLPDNLFYCLGLPDALPSGPHRTTLFLIPIVNSILFSLCSSTVS